MSRLNGGGLSDASSGPALTACCSPPTSLAACATHGLATATGAIQRLLADGDLPLHVRDAIATPIEGLLAATRAIAEIQRVIDVGSAERATVRAQCAGARYARLRVGG